MQKQKKYDHVNGYLESINANTPSLLIIVCFIVMTLILSQNSPYKHGIIPEHGLPPNVILHSLVNSGRRQRCADLVLAAPRLLNGTEKCLGNSSCSGPPNWNNTSFFTAVFISGFPHKTQTGPRTPKRPCDLAPPIMCWHGGQMYY